MEINKIGNLPDTPVPYERIHDLMTTPKCGIGYTEPIFTLEGLSNDECVGFTVEWQGGYYGVYLHPDTGWETLDLVLDDIGEVFSDPAVDEAFTLELEDKIEEHYDKQMKTYGGGVWLDSPPGVLSKLIIPHRPLFIDDIAEVQSHSFVESIMPLYGKPGEGILAVCIERSDILSFIGGNDLVFLYYNPDFGTWRVAAHGGLDIDSDIADQYHKDTGNYVGEHYNDLEVIVGPPEAIQETH